MVLSIPASFRVRNSGGAQRAPVRGEDRMETQRHPRTPIKMDSEENRVGGMDRCIRALLSDAADVWMALVRLSGMLGALPPFDAAVAWSRLWREIAYHGLCGGCPEGCIAPLASSRRSGPMGTDSGLFLLTSPVQSDIDR